MRSLRDILPALVGDTSQTSSMAKVFAGLDYARTPSTVDVLLAVLHATENASTERYGWVGTLNRTFALGALVQHRDDPRAVAELQRIASSDANPQVRQAAANALQVQVQ